MISNNSNNLTWQGDIDLTPTQIATILTKNMGKPTSPIKVNNTLEKLGLQQKTCTNKGKSHWFLTDIGHEYGHVHEVESNHSNWYGTQIKWSKRVISLLIKETPIS